MHKGLGLLTVAVSLGACSTQTPDPAVLTAPSTFQAVPVHIGQALAVTVADKDLGITRRKADNMWVVSTLVLDPQMRPAFYANLMVEGEKPKSFWEAVSAAKPGVSVYLTGAAKNRTFNGDIFPVELFQKLGQTCTDCPIVIHSHNLYNVRGQNWYGPDGKVLASEDVSWIKDMFSKVAQSVEKGDIPSEMDKRWKRLIKESLESTANAALASASVINYSSLPVMHIGSEFFKPERESKNTVTGQSTTTNTCVNWFFWSCTVRKIEGELSSSLEWGNYQQINNNMGWNKAPKQDYFNPLSAPYAYDGGNIWGDWDFPSPISRGLMVDSDYVYGQYLVGCGAMSAARLLDWAWRKGKLSNTYKFKLPNDNLANSGTEVPLNQIGISKQFMQMVFWPVKVGERAVNGSKRKVYAGWLSEKLNSSHYGGQTNTTTAELMNGTNSWLSDNSWTERLTGAWSRDVSIFSVVGMALPPVFNFVSWSQATWGVNSVLRNSIGAAPGDELPAIVGYQYGFNGTTINGIRLGGGHYALAKKFSVLEYWDWSENYATINWPDGVGDVNYANGTTRVYLSDYYDMLFAAYRPGEVV